MYFCIWIYIVCNISTTAYRLIHHYIKTVHKTAHQLTCLLAACLNSFQKSRMTMLSFPLYLCMKIVPYSLARFVPKCVLDLHFIIHNVILKLTARDVVSSFIALGTTSPGNSTISRHNFCAKGDKLS